MAFFEPAAENLVVIRPLEMLEMVERSGRRIRQSLEGGFSPKKSEKLHRFLDGSEERVLEFGPRRVAADQWHAAACREPKNTHDMYAV
jgi:hypothetical protein